MSRRTERPYKVDGADKLAQHSAVQCSVPEINGPVVQREFTSLLREACSPSPSATAGAAASNGRCAGTGVSRGHSTESNEPETKRPDGLTTREGLNLAGRHDHRWSCPGALRPTGRAPGSDHRGRERVLPSPGGLPGIAVRGPACTVVWEAGGETLPPTRFGAAGCISFTEGRKHALRARGFHVYSPHQPPPFELQTKQPDAGKLRFSKDCHPNQLRDQF